MKRGRSDDGVIDDTKASSLKQIRLMIVDRWHWQDDGASLPFRQPLEGTAVSGDMAHKMVRYSQIPDDPLQRVKGKKLYIHKVSQ